MAPPQELRHDGKTLAQGKNGFNVPSLFGMAAGGPYFHAGNARTLEECFDAAFAQHYQSGMGQPPEELFKTDQDRKNLVAYLLSLDTSTLPPAPLKYDFCNSKL